MFLATSFSNSDRISQKKPHLGGVLIELPVTEQMHLEQFTTQKRAQLNGNVKSFQLLPTREPNLIGVL